VVCLTGVGLAVLGVAGVSAFRGALLRQADQQVSAGAGQLAGHAFIVGPTGGPATEAGELVRAVTRGQWSRRLPERQGSTEMSGIARSLNQALSREEEAARAHTAQQAARAAATSRMSERLTEAARQLHGPLSVITGLARQYPRRNAPTPAETDRVMKRVAQEATRMAGTLDTLSPPSPSDTPP
jgi:two-component system OmpR family sensor kinase